MKKLILPFAALILFSFSADTTKLNEQDREWMLKHLTETRNHMTQVLEGLTNSQLNFKPDENSWSIAECVEHLAVTENGFGGLIQKTVGAGPNPVLKDSLVFKDEDIMANISDRSNKVKTSEAFEPSGQFESFENTLQAFLEKRNAHIEYVKTTEDDLRNRYSEDLPFGPVDGVQLIIFAAGHTERHVLQMEEVMAHTKFPK
ncbi:DinB family protein [Flagellimonas alvinocaridis]|uniref:DinB family protein n=1 Tax=Flagellimonas alvinocaridis TaxID=2530200 RepID=A0A4S8S1M2_9FLAO|nr:DinB family protein [Allomuricauda alvinocaridis]THV61484.1 DinB family protein [Allomuricauda alvinocaridis]